ncbi:uncharacterized protein CtIP isoform X1 [Drosophila kikkawai]|uniref:Uncharacterized protein CtIP isoform X1 n=2 Tax=Drosophila kikkawai TaxID=30033 RepID=A0ABM4GEK4_DROKI|nr:uncharacterized protein LOC108075236 isoform X1 [Drosophila kikkawai]
MTCGTCRGHKERSVKCLIAALDIIKDHALMMQQASEESDKTIENLKAHNEKLHKALDLLKERQESMTLMQAEKRRKLSPKKPNDDISPLPQSQNSLNMNIALNSIELSDEDQEMEEDESITETETNSLRSPRKLKSLLNRKPDIRNLENVQPNSLSTSNQNWISKTPKNPAVLTKLSLTHKGSALGLKQTRLKFESNKTSTSEKDVIEDSPNLSSSKSRPSRSLMQRTDTVTASSAGDAKLDVTSSSSLLQMPKPTFELEDDAEFDMDSSELPLMPPPATPPFLKMNSTSDSVVLLTPATQDIIFVNDTLEDHENVDKLGTMDVLAEIMKDDDDACSNALRQFEKKMIDQQKQNKPTPQAIQITRPVKQEPISQPAEPDLGNESTKLPEDIEKYMMDIKDEDESKDSVEEEEEEFPRPIVVKNEPELTLKERHNINCPDCEKFINFMGSNLTDEKIKDYLNNCRHVDARSSTPPGFWNPHMVSFAENDPRNEVLIDNRFRDQRLNK